MHTNKTILSGEVVKLYPLRQTPDGLTIASFVLEHQSMQLEAKVTRVVKCRMFCLIVDVSSTQINQLESGFVNVEGFLSQNSKAQIVLNVTQIINKGL